MHRIAELLRRRRIRIVRAQIGVVRLVAVGAPVALVLAGVGVEHDHAMVAVAVGDVELVGLLGRRRSWPAAAGSRRRCCLCSGRGLPICIRNLPSCVNFRTMLSLNDWRAAGLALVLLAVLSPAAAAARRRDRAGRRRSAAVAADPDVAFVVDGDAVIRIRPVVALPGSAPVPDQIAGLRRTREPAARARSTAPSAESSSRAVRPASSEPAR